MKLTESADLEINGPIELEWAYHFVSNDLAVLMSKDDEIGISNVGGVWTVTIPADAFVVMDHDLPSDWDLNGATSITITDGTHNYVIDADNTTWKQGLTAEEFNTRAEWDGVRWTEMLDRGWVEDGLAQVKFAVVGDNPELGAFLRHGELEFPFVTYTGQERDWETKLNYHGRRYYDAPTGQFIGQDPVEQYMNGYMLGGNSHPNMVDSDGLFSAAHGSAFGGMWGGMYLSPQHNSPGVASPTAMPDPAQSGSVNYRAPLATHYGNMLPATFASGNTPYVVSGMPSGNAGFVDSSWRGVPYALPTSGDSAPITTTQKVAWWQALAPSPSWEMAAWDWEMQSADQTTIDWPSVSAMTPAGIKRSNNPLHQEFMALDMKGANRNDSDQYRYRILANLERNDYSFWGSLWDLGHEVGPDVAMAWAGVRGQPSGDALMARRSRPSLYGEAFSIRIDPRVPGRPDPRYSIDTSTFSTGKQLKGGGIRNAPEFWSQWQTLRPEMISPANADRIKQLQINPYSPSPRVDDVWVQHLPAHRDYQDAVLVHHHVGPYAIPVPYPTHPGNNREWHGE